MINFRSEKRYAQITSKIKYFSKNPEFILASVTITYILGLDDGFRILRHHLLMRDSLMLYQLGFVAQDSETK
jgi:hypothetical protein